MKQRTLLREGSITGKGIHTGQTVNVKFLPAPVDHGIVFRRMDLYAKPEIRPIVSQVSELVRSTTISSGHAKIQTIEHVLSALNGMNIDNLLVEMDASEPPILDGSAKHFVNLFQQLEPVEQEKPKEFFVLKEPISVSSGNRSIIALPYDGLKITCTSSDDRGIHTQHLSLTIDPETYIAQIAPARTFTIYEDIEPLLKMGKLQGGSLDSAIVLKGNKIISKEPLRFKDEFVRHKILDILGDIALLGLPIKAHIIAVRPGHALNAELTKALLAQYEAQKEGSHKEAKKKASVQLESESSFDIRRVLDIMPHRYPFVMIDRVLSVSNDDELVAIKNVTINEPFFQGHFPGNPVMPGVLQIEAMAQAAGILLLRQMSDAKKMAFFMSCDKAKFRQAVVPGDQLVIHIRLNKTKKSGSKMIATASCECKVMEKTVSSAEVMFTVMDATE